MKIVIKIPYHVYEHAKNTSEDSNDEWDAMRAIAKGFPYEERPHGEWVKEYLQIDEHHFRSFAKCKVCGCSFKPYSFAVKEFDFCPKCGSDMRKVGEAE